MSPAAQPQDTEEGTEKPLVVKPRKFWIATAPWSIKKDGISAALEFVRALIGYILYDCSFEVEHMCFGLTMDRMLAVMTYNIGFLFAVTGSVLLGELVFGRYTRGSASLAEDGCHS